MEVTAPARRFIRREVHRPETQDIIYQAAIKLFRERGYHATSIRDIATAAGIQPATIYHYFGNKEALLYTIMEQVIIDLLKVQEHVLSTSDDPVELLQEMVRAHVQFHCEHALEAFISDTELRALSDEFYAKFLAYRDQYQARFRSVIEDGVKRGVFTVPDVRVTTNILLIMSTGAVAWYCSDGRLPLKEIANIHAELALKAVLTPQKQCG
ncbi:MAG: TetR/AcrR family transcriptional regulator [Ktedonobacteraceae bacterium]